MKEFNEYVANEVGSSVEAVLIDGLSLVLDDNGMSYQEDIGSYLEDFSYNNGLVELEGKEGFLSILTEFEGSYTKNNNLLGLLIMEIKDSGYIDYETLLSYIDGMYKRLDIEDEKEEKLQNSKDLRSMKEDNADQLDYVYNNFDIESIDGYEKIYAEAEVEVSLFLHDIPELSQNREEYIFSYILIKNKDYILNDYKSKIGQIDGYTPEGLLELETNIINVQQNIQLEHKVFNEFLYQKNSKLVDSLNNTNLNILVKSQIENSLFTIGGRNEKIIYDGNYVIIGDQRVEVDEHGRVKTEIFNKSNYALEINNSISLPLLDSYSELDNIYIKLNILDINKEDYEKKIDILKYENMDYINDGFDNKTINDNKERIGLIEGEIDNINKKEENLEYDKLILLNKIKKLEYDNRIFNQNAATTARESITFLHDIGFDIMPQVVTDQLIDILNSSPSLRNSFGLNSEINFAKGCLGIETDMDRHSISITEKVIFAEFFNSFISGEPNKPINIELIKSGYRPVYNRDKFRIKLGNSGMLLGTLSITTGLQNLEDAKEKNSD